MTADGSRSHMPFGNDLILTVPDCSIIGPAAHWSGYDE